MPENAKKAGWNLKQAFHSANGLTFELKRGFFDKATIKIKIFSEDTSLEVQASKEAMKREIMDVAESAITNSCDKPSEIVIWRKQEQMKAQLATKAWAPDWNPNAQVQPQEQAVPVQTPQPPPAPKPAAPKLEACLHCNAPLTYDPEEVLVICNYCGYMSNTTGEEPPRYSMLPVEVQGSESLKIAQTHVGKGILVTKGMAERADWGAIVLRYIPIWNVPLQLGGYVEGKKALIKSKGAKGQMAQDLALNTISGIGVILGGGKIQTTDRLEYNTINETMYVHVVARRAPEIQPDVGTCKFSLNKKEAFRKTGEETLNVEISSEEAFERAKTMGFEDVKARYTTTRKFSPRASLAGEPELIYAPWWFIEYSMGGKDYSVIVDAYNGLVIAGKRPWIPKGAKWR